MQIAIGRAACLKCATAVMARRFSSTVRGATVHSRARRKEAPGESGGRRHDWFSSGKHRAEGAEGSMCTSALLSGLGCLQQHMGSLYLFTALS
uniref:Uncharacterized protein n=1 Tax=Knipowitschia caucasica TaxID=637954 RepID=A0AAV2JVN0_KNICA